MKALSYIISLIFLWSTGAMAFAPGFLQVAGGGGRVYTINDALYEASSTALTSHTVSPGPGGSWSTLTTPIFYVDSTGVKCNTVYDRAIATNSTTLGSSGVIEISGSPITASSSFSGGGFTSSGVNGYLISVASAGTVTLFRADSGTYTALTTDTIAGFNQANECTIVFHYYSNGDMYYEIKVSGSIVVTSATVNDTTHVVSRAALYIYDINGRITDIKTYAN
jgi:hypothetical protein